MRNKLMILFVMILLLSVISLIATGSTLLRSDSSIKLTTEESALIKTKVKSVNIESSPISCDNKICWSDIKQEGLIDTRFITDRYYCSKFDENNSCIQTTNYTKEQLMNLRDSFIKSRLTTYANAIKTRDKSNVIDIDSGGTITENEK